MGERKPGTTLRPITGEGAGQRLARKRTAVPVGTPLPRFSNAMRAETAGTPTDEECAMAVTGNRALEVERRRSDAADVIAETLLDLWLRGRRRPLALPMPAPREGRRRV